jgi:hypothetical protein
MRVAVVAILLFGSQVAAQRSKDDPARAIRAADTVSVGSYFVAGIVSGIPTSYVSSVAFTDDRSARTIVVSATGVAAAIASWTRASHMGTTDVVIPLNVQDREGYLQSYRSHLIARRRLGVAVGFLTGIAAGFFILLPPLSNY